MEEREESPSTPLILLDAISTSDVPAISTAEIENILQERHPDRVLFAILNPSGGYDFVRQADERCLPLHEVVIVH